MELKKYMPMMFVIIILAFMVVQPVSAAAPRIVLFDTNSNQVTSFHSNQHDEVLEIYAVLYVDGEWKAWRDLSFDIFDPKGNKIIHCDSVTSVFSGYAGIGIWNMDLKGWKPGNYTVKVSYAGNEENGWPATSTAAVIHHTK
jgi:hypothetical protein